MNPGRSNDHTPIGENSDDIPLAFSFAPVAIFVAAAVNQNFGGYLYLYLANAALADRESVQ